MTQQPSGGELRVALTFDAEHPDRPMCPPGNSERILDALAWAGARATFFVQGRWATAYPDAAARIAGDGHLVGSHSQYHAAMPMLSDKGLRADLRVAGSAIRQMTGSDPRPWFRCPFGAGQDDPRVLRALSDLGYRQVNQHVVLRDWEPHRLATELVEDAVRAVQAHGDGVVVLLHSWPAVTGDALPLMLGRLAAAGVTFVGVDELDALP